MAGATSPPGPPGGRMGPQAPTAAGDFLGLLAAIIAGLLGPAGEAPDPGDGDWAPGGTSPPWPLALGPTAGGRAGPEATLEAGSTPSAGPPPAGAAGKPTVVSAKDRTADRPSGRAGQTMPANPPPADAEGISPGAARLPAAGGGRPESGGRLASPELAVGPAGGADASVPAWVPVREGRPLGFKDPESAGIPGTDRFFPGRTEDLPARPHPVPADMLRAAATVSPPAGPDSPAPQPAGGEPVGQSRFELFQVSQPLAERLAAAPGPAGSFITRPEGPAASSGALAEQAAVLAARLVREGPGQAVFWLRLEPPELGRVELKVRLRPEGSFEVELRPQTPTAYNLLAGALEGLKEVLAGRGMTLAGLTVFDPWGGVHDREPRGGRGRSPLKPPAPAGALASAVGVSAGPEPEAVGPGRLIDRKA